MLTAAPLPDWSSLIRAAFGLRRAVDVAAPWRGPGDVAGWLSHSAWSLALVAQWRKRAAAGPAVTVWVPDLFCNASLVALRATGATLVFYPLNQDLTPDFAAFQSLPDAKPPDVFLLVHFFGRPSNGAAAREYCERSGSWLVEDGAHVLRRSGGVGEYGDFVLYSPHKHLATPDCAVLIARAQGAGQLGAAGVAALGPPDTWPAQLSDLQHKMGCSAMRSALRTGSWLFKRLLQRVARRRWSQQHVMVAEPVSSSPAAVAPVGMPAPSWLGRRLLPQAVPDIEGVARQRLNNQRLWDGLLSETESLQKFRIVAAERPGNQEWVPYLAAYRVAPEDAQSVADELQRQNLPVTTWPDLPPEVSSNQRRHTNAWEQRHSRLYLYVHQTLRVPRIRE
jgi:DegT/DnrJ/EryC1/StrS aminotransferase family